MRHTKIESLMDRIIIGRTKPADCISLNTGDVTIFEALPIRMKHLKVGNRKSGSKTNQGGGSVTAIRFEIAHDHLWLMPSESEVGRLLRIWDMVTD